MTRVLSSLLVENVSKSFGSLQALSDVNIDLGHGERRAIIGPNGAGKTTLFHVICGNIPASFGKVYLFGQDITQVPVHRRSGLGLARTFQVTNLFPNLNVLENVILSLQAHRPMKFSMHRRLSSYQAIYVRAREMMETWQLWETRDALVQNLSYGEQRQVELLLALAGDPKVLLLDEPTAGLSPGETTIVTSLIRGLDKDMSILLIEHDMDVVFGLVDQITVLHQGQVLASGTSSDIQADSRVTDIYLGTGDDEVVDQ